MMPERAASAQQIRPDLNNFQVDLLRHCNIQKHWQQKPSLNLNPLIIIDIL